MHRPLPDVTWLLIVIAALAGPRPANAKGLTFAELKQRSQQIEQMTKWERETVQRNWKVFQALPEDQQQRYRWLHQALESDKQSGNQLNETLQTYAAWLQTLAPGERVALRDAATPEERLRKVREIKADKERRNQSRALNEPADDPSYPRWDFRRSLAQPLSSADLEAVMNALAETLPRPEREEIARIDPVHDRWMRYRLIIDASARQAGGPQLWPTPNQQAAMVAAIPKSEPARHLKNLTGDQSRLRWGSILFSSFRQEWKTLREPFHPKDSDLRQVFDSLEPIERGEWMSSSKERLQEHLIRRYYSALKDKNSEYRAFEKTSLEFSQFAFRFMHDAGIGPAGFFRGGGPPGQGRRFGGGREGRSRPDRERNGPPPDGPPPEGRDFRPPPRDRERPPPHRPPDGE